MATATTSVSGLVSGLDTSTIISQLMQIEAEPQTALKTTLTNTQTAVTSYQGLNTKFQALLTAAQNLTNTSTWGARTATSSDSSVAASATASALSGSVTFTVNQLASAQSLMSVNAASSLTDTSSFTPSGANGSFTITDASGTATAITPTDGSLQSVVNAVNNSAAGVKAAAVQVAPGQYRLQLTSATTGSAGTFTVDGLDGLGGTTQVNAGTDASIHVGATGSGFDVVSSSNTFNGVSPGLTFTVSQAGVTSTVSIANDQNSIATAVSGLVDAANAVLTAISAQTAAGTVGSDGTRTGQGALASDYTIKAMTSSVLQAVTSAVGGASAAKYGIQSTQDGALTFNKDTFLSAYAADPAGAQALIAPVGGTGVAQRLATVATNASDPVTGSITSLIAGQNSTITRLNSEISDWDVRLAQRQTSLQTQYTAMEVALQKLQSQASWLSGMTSSSSSGSSSSSSSSSSS
jgi:flagellar hook-associated protein 2